MTKRIFEIIHTTMTLVVIPVSWFFFMCVAMILILDHKSIDMARAIPVLAVFCFSSTYSMIFGVFNLIQKVKCPNCKVVFKPDFE